MLILNEAEIRDLVDAGWLVQRSKVRFARSPG